MIEVNLIPDVKRELLKAQRARGVVISMSILVSIIAAGVVVLLLVYMYGVQWARGAFLDGQINDKNTSLSKVEDLSKILTIQNQLSSITALNNSKNMTSRVFDVMSAVTPTDKNSVVSFSQITIAPGGVDTATAAAASSQTSTGGQFHLEGQTSNYESMEVFKKIISNTIFEYTVGTDKEVKKLDLASNISTTDISYGEDANGQKVLRFTLTFDYPAELFSPESNNLVFKLNVNGNVTDSYLGIPRFAERAQDIKEGN